MNSYADFLSFSPGRIGAIVAGLLGVIGIGLAVRAWRRRRGTVMPVVLGLAGMAIGAVVVATADGGLGTGNGLGGGYVALVVGLASALIGVWVRLRSAQQR